MPSMGSVAALGPAYPQLLSCLARGDLAAASIPARQVLASLRASGSPVIAGEVLVRAERLLESEVTTGAYAVAALAEAHLLRHGEDAYLPSSEGLGPITLLLPDWNFTPSSRHWGARIFDGARRFQRGLLRERQDEIFDEMMRDPALKQRMIAFIDVAASARPADLPRYLDLYFPPDEARELKGVLGFAIRAGIYRHRGRRFVNEFLVAWGIQRSLRMMGNRFLMGEGPGQAMKKVRSLSKKGIYSTLNVVTEHIVSSEEADRYRDRILDLMALWMREHRGPEVTAGGVPVRHHSFKLSALTHRLHPLAFERLLKHPHEARARLYQLFKKAREYSQAGHPVMLQLDPEERYVRDISYRIFWDALMDPTLADWDEVGIGIQAYFRDSEAVLMHTIDLARQTGKRPQVRIIKGAYHRYEQIIAALIGWPVPVYDFQDETDRSFSRMVALALQNHRYIRVAWGTHNYRDLDIVHSIRGRLGLPLEVAENQFLYGVGDPMLEAVVGEGLIARAYGPLGGYVEGTPYQARRLPEVTPDSAIGMTHLEGMTYRLYLEEMWKRGERRPPEVTPRPEFENEPASNFSDGEVRKEMQAAIDEASRRKPVQVVPLIGEEEISFDGARAYLAKNPGDLSHTIGRVMDANEAEVDRAIDEAQTGFEIWSSDYSQGERSRILRRAAELTRERMFEIAADIVVESGKPWANALADLQEGIDFLNAYALSAEKLKGRKPLGVGLAIAPFNFPFAIAVGEVAGPLSQGNAVILKPAEQVPIVGRHVVKILRDAGVPKQAVQLVPGKGEVVGQRLVESRKVDFIAFTGSKEAADRILETVAENPSTRNGIKVVVAETGGKNPLIVDESADLDIAVEAILDGAFGMAGERCSAVSRVIVVESMAEKLIKRLVDGARSMVVGDPRQMATQVGPLIDDDARQKALGFISRLQEQIRGDEKRKTRLVFGGDLSGLDKAGYYLAPHIFADVSPDDEIAKQEIFAPVLSVITVPDFNQAMKVANDTPYGLTAALISRNPDHIRRFLSGIQAGNAYVNRAPVGAMVLMQPFGGGDASGTGPQAGGPHYVERFTRPAEEAGEDLTHLSLRLSSEGPNLFNPRVQQDVVTLLQGQKRWARATVADRIAVIQTLKSDLPLSLQPVVEQYIQQAPLLLTPQITIDKPGEVNKSAHDRPLGIGLVWEKGESVFNVVAATVAAIVAGNAVLLPDDALGREIRYRFEAAGLPPGLIVNVDLTAVNILGAPWLDFVVAHGKEAPEAFSNFIRPRPSRQAFKRFIGVTDSPLDSNYLARFAIARTKTVKTLRFGDQLSPGDVL